MKLIDSYEALETAQTRYFRLQGGAGSGKSIAVAQHLLLLAMTQPGHRIFCFRKVGRTVRDSLFATFRDLISENNLRPAFSINQTMTRFQCLTTGVEIICMGMDDPEKIKSIKDPTLIWMEEATEFDRRDFRQLDLRLRKEGIQNGLILTYNPINTGSWIYTDLEQGQQLAGRETFLKTTFRDNPFLPPEYVSTLERLIDIDPHAHKVYALGEWSNDTKGLVFPNFKIIDSIPQEAQEKVVYGLDFGFVDPMALIKVCETESRIYLQELYYRSGEGIEHLIHFLRAYDLKSTSLIFCDSANPADIQRLYNAGFRGAQPATKGPGSIEAGIRMMHEKDLYVTADSFNLLKELREYRYHEDKTGRLLEGRPVDGNDHAIDAARYAVLSKQFKPHVGARTGGQVPIHKGMMKKVK